MKVGLVTWCGDPTGIEGDQPLVQALNSEGHEVSWCVWDDLACDWASLDIAVIRTTWDYYLRHDEFLNWVDFVSRTVRLFNAPELVRWNSHKSYLLELADADVPVIETRLLRKGETISLSELEWDEIVAKPAVSAAAHRTARFSTQDEQAQAFVDDLACECDVLIQPYLPEIGDHGETSMIFIDGAPVATVRRESALLHGIEAADEGSTRDPLVEELHVAELALAQLPTKPLYARVDVVRRASGPVLLELELIEPFLFMHTNPVIAQQFARAISNAPLGDPSS